MTGPRTLLVLQGTAAPAGPWPRADRVTAGFEEGGDVVVSAQWAGERRLPWRRDAGAICRDYTLYAVREAYPDYGFYWFASPETAIHTDDAEAWFAEFADETAALIAAHFRRQDRGWRWAAPIEKAGYPAYGMSFALFRVSAAAIDTLVQARQALAAGICESPAETWPNDESFVASVLTASGARCADLNDAGARRYGADSFVVDYAIDRAVLAHRLPDGRVYHPVRDGEAWLAEAARQLERMPDAPAPDSTRGEASFLRGLARFCLQDERRVGAAPIGLLMAERLFEERPWAASAPDSEAEADERAALALDRLFRSHFGDAAEQSVGTIETPGGAPKPVERYRAGFALPRGFDVVTHQLVLGLHLRPLDTLADGDLAWASEDARAVLRIDHDRMAAVFPDPPGAPAPVLVFDLDPEAAAALHAATLPLTPLTAFRVAAMADLATEEKAAGLTPALRRAAARAIVNAIRAVSPAHVAVIALDPRANALAPTLAGALPEARLVRVTRARDDWADGLRLAGWSAESAAECAIAARRFGAMPLLKNRVAAIDAQEALEDPARWAAILGLPGPDGGAAAARRLSMAAPDYAGSAWRAAFERAVTAAARRTDQVAF